MIDEGRTLPFSEATAAWFTRRFGSPTPVQAQGWSRIAEGRNALLVAPTGSGKTLAAFLYFIDRLCRRPDPRRAPGVRVLYVSPLKALVYDVNRNLRTPLAGVGELAKELGQDLELPDIAVRTGDTLPKERQRQIKHPSDILVTTPESLYLMLGSAARETLRSVEAVIIDEVHALMPTKRGAHLALSLERLAALTQRDPQRIGLSATARPVADVAAFLGGDRAVEIVDTSARPQVDVRVVVPVDDMTRPPVTPVITKGKREQPQRSVWPSIYPELIAHIEAKKSTLIFVNSRGLAERLCEQLNELWAEKHGAPVEQSPIMAHHGSVSHERRREVEEALKSGRARAIVATSSLELGIDMGAIELVIMVESPGAVSSGLQRIGRAGHQVGETSEGLIFPKHRGDLLEATVVAEAMGRGDIEPLRAPQNALDVLAQQLVAMAAVTPLKVDTLRPLVQRAYPYRTLPESAFLGVLDMLSGRYPSTDFAEFRAQLDWDREANVIAGRRGSKLVSAVSGGTIADRGLYTVHLGEKGPRIGELDEEMVYETTPGQVFMLGASAWRVMEVTRDRVIVEPAPGEVGRLPFWHGEGPGRPLSVGRAMGALTRQASDVDGAALPSFLQAHYPLDARAAKNLAAYLVEQREATGVIPSEKTIVIERFRDELGDYRVCILSPFGARVHAPWAMAIQGALSAEAGFTIGALYTDDGIVLSFPDLEEPPPLSWLMPTFDEAHEHILAALPHSSVFAGHFRENAARALLLPRRRAHGRTPLWVQRLRSQRLMAAALQHRTFPVVMETFRSVLQDVFDLSALESVLRGVAAGEVEVHAVQTDAPSPFARSLMFAYVATHLYQGDAPLAERRAQALAVDRRLLLELLGEADLRALLDPEVISLIESELQCRAPGFQARHDDGLVDVLRRNGHYSLGELAARVSPEFFGTPELDDSAKTDALRGRVEDLIARGRVVSISLGDEICFIASEDAGLYRTALGVAMPEGLPEVYLDAPEDSLHALVGRHLRTRGPCTLASVAAHFELRTVDVEPALLALEHGGRAIRGAFLPGETGEEWCDPDVMRRLKRATLSRLRRAIEPVDAATLTRFLLSFHGVYSVQSLASQPRRTRDARLDALLAALTHLEGLPLSFQVAERLILPVRVPAYQSADLDQLGVEGSMVWLGHAPLGQDDGQVVFLRREALGTWSPPRDVDENGAGARANDGQADDGSECEAAVLSALRAHGACFLRDLETSCAPYPRRAIEDALFALVFDGKVTNDSPAALRELLKRHRRAKSRPSRQRLSRRTSLRVNAAGATGRFALVSSQRETETERLVQKVRAYLGRHGVLGRASLAAEQVAGGFSAIYPVLRALEDAGQVRRGHFVEALEGAQFAEPSVVERLRACRAKDASGDVFVLSATDPANPYGALLPWPKLREEGVTGGGQDSTRSPRRATSATVIIKDGHALAHVEGKGAILRCFELPDDAEMLGSATWAASMVHALRFIAEGQRGRILSIGQIDGEPARRSAFFEALVSAGAGTDHRGLVIEAPAVSYD